MRITPVLIGALLAIGSHSVLAGVSEPPPAVPGPTSVPALGGWGLALLAAGVGGIAIRWFRSRNRD